MRYIKGDLIDLAKKGEFDVIIHGCNCFCTMGAGVAKSIKQVFPKAYQADMNTKKGDKGKLGLYTYTFEYDFMIVNAYTQYNYNGFGDLFEYEAFEKCLKLLSKDIDFMLEKKGKAVRIGLPKIGAGLAGGDWNRISKLIENGLNKYDVTIVEYQR